ncbi:uncharacterized protein N7484_009934 [Penicillium longicatenatum]|uniref:uncharacterized protein n=1 Tax=Penicillium longicatenatum TaxID=1561947 RepID=UPI0025485844|nr:uncharacterized protein N7484_009934 [Penicillium longicatenatum]KAJ5636621.1 hypothetical protein N7484_009934 [Penicillium longicatenatum]
MSEYSTTPHGETSPAQSAPQQPLNRSCESCRNLKVRCLPNPTTPNQCQRCAKGNKVCTFVAPQRRRPRKRTDSRVAQLEKEMRVMRTLIKDKIREESEPESSDASDNSQDNESGDMDYHCALGSIPESAGGTSESARFMDYSAEFIDTPHPGMHGSGSLSAPLTLSGLHANFLSVPSRPRDDDVVDRGIISHEDAEQLVAFFIHELSTIFPLVILPPTTTAAQLRQAAPVLFLSVISAAAISIDTDLASVLNRELVRLYADRFFIEGEKSLELVQALLLMMIFYFPPGSPLKLQFYQYAHIASTMALEIGLATKRRVTQKKPDRKKSGPHDELMAEQARAILGCYHLSSTVGMKTRRPNLLQFNNWMEECVFMLKNSPHQTDQRLAVWFELQRITDESLSSFGLDDTSSLSTLTESRVQAVLRWFDKQMEVWRKNTPNKMLTVPMILEYRSTILAMYELSVGAGYRDPDAVKRRDFTLPNLEEDGNSQRVTPMSVTRIDITVKWMNAAHELLDALLTCSAETMRRFPNLMYTRFTMAMTSLLKIHFSVRTSALGEVITPETVNVSYYLDAMSNKLGEASGGGKYKIPTRWYHVIAVKSRDWYERLEKRYSGSSPDRTRVVGDSTNPTERTTAAQMASHDPAVHTDSAFPMAPGVSHMAPGIENGYVAMSSAGMWPMDVSHQNTFFQPPLGGYPQQAASLPPQFSFDPQRLASQQIPGAGMELDGWLPDGSIFGMPPLPEF